MARSSLSDASLPKIEIAVLSNPRGSEAEVE